METNIALDGLATWAVPSQGHKTGGMHQEMGARELLLGEVSLHGGAFPCNTSVWFVVLSRKDQHVSCLKALKSYCTFGLWQVCLPHPPSKGRHSRTSSFPRITCWTPKSLLTWSCCLVVGIHWDICIFWHSFTWFWAQTTCFKLLSTICTRLDADAALVRHHVDILGGIAQQMQLGADKTYIFNWGFQKMDDLFNSSLHALECFV